MISLTRRESLPGYCLKPTKRLFCRRKSQSHQRYSLQNFLPELNSRLTINFKPSTGKTNADKILTKTHSSYKEITKKIKVIVNEVESMLKENAILKYNIKDFNKFEITARERFSPVQ